jgi:hypothetical protein
MRLTQIELQMYGLERHIVNMKWLLREYKGYTDDYTTFLETYCEEHHVEFSEIDVLKKKIIEYVTSINDSLQDILLLEKFDIIKNMPGNIFRKRMFVQYLICIYKYNKLNKLL